MDSLKRMTEYLIALYCLIFNIKKQFFSSLSQRFSLYLDNNFNNVVKPVFFFNCIDYSGIFLKKGNFVQLKESWLTVKCMSLALPRALGQRTQFL